LERMGQIIVNGGERERESLNREREREREERGLD
jgi:hypothetical protein